MDEALPSPALSARIGAHLTQIRARISEAAKKSGRDPASVTLVAVTKSAGPEAIRALLNLGVKELAENRVQAALPRMATLQAEVTAAHARWRMIGHLQTNKAKQALQNFSSLDAVDSVHLLEALAKEAGRLNLKKVPCLAEVNVSGESQKYGLSPDTLQAFLKKAGEFSELEIQGLMTMAPYAADLEQVVRPVFRGLRELLQTANAQNWYTAPLRELSMGMSRDFEIAVEEGATMVRVGTALFQ